MIVEELKKEEKNENFLIELCECYLLHKERYIPSKLISNCLPFFFEVSLSKEKDEETQKKVEMALLALSCIKAQNRIEKTMYLEEIKEIIKYHQEHHNLTHLAYQSAWRFLIFRLRNGENLEEVIMNELHFVRESARELEDLTACVDWKKSKEEMKILKEVQIIRNWTDEMIDPLEHYELRKDDVARMILSLVKLCIASRDNEQGMTGDCLYILKGFAENATVSVDVFLKEGVFELILMEILESTLDDEITFYSLQICFLMFEMLNEETDNDAEEAKRKAAKMELFENLEEEGYEDAIVSFHGILVFLQEDYDDDLSLNISDYFVNV
eukprot:MONOS_3072.1-p1 / transcript=MONOS_3072.1 / gene=MONOS_3072 / organism=Monocercomonoides_exilis_PA203 / gene_product=unspecified product / transcript_product=unspecified product / location=Mono_scaffold00068:146877-147915(-) / protein_length=327 / sequence_SO=supercontig / SO=protein_coding / is_pseudo=false